jgi:dienelactone hydrolase
VLDWAEQQPEIDATQLGVFGVSLGAIDGVVLAALDDRVKALVVAMAGGDLPYLMLNTHYRPVVRRVDALAESEGTSREALSAALDARLRTDPLTLARYVDAQRVLMIITRTDAIIPFEAQQRLRASLGTPETLYLATGHRPSVVFFPKVRAASFEFFTRQFAAVQVGLARN